MFKLMKSKKLKKVAKVAALSAPVALMSEPASAAPIGQILGSIQENAIQPAITFVKFGSIAAGVGLSALGVYDIYKAKTSQGAANVSLGGAVLKLVIGVGLTSLFFIIQAFQDTAGAESTDLDVGGSVNIN